MLLRQNHDMHIRLWSFQVGEEVYALNHRRAPNWIPGKVTAVLDPLTGIIRFDDGTETRYHVDHVKAQIQEGERESEKFRQPELDSFPAIVTTSDRQASLIADVEQGV